MLRECYRVLKRPGYIAGYVIHTPPGLSGLAEARAAELGPSDVASPLSLTALVRSAGFSTVLQENVTATFRATCEALIKARVKLEKRLRKEEGDAVYEEEIKKKRAMLKGVREGLLLRSRIVAQKSGGA